MTQRLSTCAVPVRAAATSERMSRFRTAAAASPRRTHHLCRVPRAMDASLCGLPAPGLFRVGGPLLGCGLRRGASTSWEFRSGRWLANELSSLRWTSTTAAGQCTPTLPLRAWGASGGCAGAGRSAPLAAPAGGRSAGGRKLGAGGGPRCGASWATWVPGGGVETTTRMQVFGALQARADRLGAGRGIAAVLRAEEIDAAAGGGYGRGSRAGRHPRCTW